MFREFNTIELTFCFDLPVVADLAVVVGDHHVAAGVVVVVVSVEEKGPRLIVGLDLEVREVRPEALVLLPAVDDVVHQAVQAVHAAVVVPLDHVLGSPTLDLGYILA